MNKIEPHLRIFQPAAKTRPQAEVVDPYDRKPWQSLDLADADDIEQALQAASAVHADRGRWLDGDERIEILSRAASHIEAKLEEFTEDLAREGGKPYSDAKIETVRAVDGLRNCSELLRNHGAGEGIATGINAASKQRISFSSHEPIGVVVAISAFNHPLNLAVHQIGPAIAAGCPFVLKPATATPFSAYRLLDVLHQCGLPADHGQALLTQNSQLSQALACDRRVGFLSFIGSAEVGWMLRSCLAAGARCALEHGGSAPVIVDKGVDIAKTAALLARGGYYHAGQVCISVQRVYADEAIAEELAAALVETAGHMPVGAQLEKGTAIGPMISSAEVERVHSWVGEACAGGGKLMCGGEAVSKTCYPATLVWSPPQDCRLSREEVFGPVIALWPYKNVDEAIASANALDYKFQAAVFSPQLDFAMHCYRRLNAAAVMINDHTAWRVDWMPFAGLGHSGYGVGGIPYTFEDMQTRKLAVLQSPSL